MVAFCCYGINIVEKLKKLLACHVIVNFVEDGF